MDKLLEEIYNDYKEGYTGMDYTYHDDELGYDRYTFTLENNRLMITEYLLDYDEMMTGSNKLFLPETITLEEFKRDVNSAIYYIALDVAE